MTLQDTHGLFGFKDSMSGKWPKTHAVERAMAEEKREVANLR